MTSSAGKQGLITKAISGFYTVETEEGSVSCQPKGVFRKQQISPLVGDQAICDLEQGSYRITKILPRKNEWIRPPVANIDQLGIVLSTCNPSVSYPAVDILLTAAYYTKIVPLLILTKTDLASCQPIRSAYQSLALPIFVIDAEKGGLTGLKEQLSGKITVLCGNSGVGKSTLLNRLLGFSASATGEISQKLGRGKHTTRHVELFHLAGGYLADTPGFSSLSFVQYVPSMEPRELDQYFPDFSEYRTSCKFPDCSHQKEAGCSVIKAVDEGKISPFRYQNYLRFYQELKDYKKSCRK